MVEDGSVTKQLYFKNNIKSIKNQKTMTTVKRIFERVSEKKDALQMTKRISLAFTNKRNVWNGKRRFSY